MSDALGDAITARLKAWEGERVVERMWAKDGTLWAASGKSADEMTRWLGWLDLPGEMTARVDELEHLARDVREDGYGRAAVLGMGGSSLAPDLFAHLFAGPGGAPVGDGLELRILDSTHPDVVRGFRSWATSARTLFCVSSKSGSTTEPNAFHAVMAAEAPALDFVAITDPGSALADVARAQEFRAIIDGRADVGGRYSALSVFGLVPAALVGLDVARLARGARDFGETALRRPAADNPGLRLGAVMAEAALLDPPRDALTFRVAPSLAAFPVWIEQLVAESLGKDGKGVLPVVDEPTRELDAYGPDRVFLRMGLREEIEEDDASQGAEILRRITDAGHPVVTVTLADRWSLAAAMLLWEVATAAAGAAMGVQPFDQPDVELAKVRGREALAGGAAGTGGVDEITTDDPDQLARALENWSRVRSHRTGPDSTERRRAGSHPAGKPAAPYVAIQAFLPPDPRTDHALRGLRTALADRLGIATTAGYGPRFLHSTGQLHKGGPDTGLFLQLVDDADSGPAIPGSDHGFGDLVRAQALGDYRALAERGRRVLRVRLAGDRATALAHLRSAIDSMGASGVEPL